MDAYKIIVSWTAAYREDSACYMVALYKNQNDEPEQFVTIDDREPDSLSSPDFTKVIRALRAECDVPPDADVTVEWDV